MFTKGKKQVKGYQDNSFGLGILKESFSQLPVKGKVNLKKYLQNLLSMQNSMAGAASGGKPQSSLNEGKMFKRRG